VVEASQPAAPGGLHARAVAAMTRTILVIPKLTIAVWIVIGATGMLLLPEGDGRFLRIQPDQIGRLRGFRGHPGPLG
jgi:hypothetical protein